MNFGRAVRIMRTARGMTQAELAERVGSSQRIISFIETGLVRATDETAAKIQKVLDFSPASDEALKVLVKDAD
ncbi:MAG TPA: helix-turn-helix transcriptional regulator [Sedimentisphaerales bacterium]|nr:helix-turn-helix transcriptional regulator [Sedimentisphaerales bacterium]